MSALSHSLATLLLVVGATTVNASGGGRDGIRDAAHRARAALWALDYTAQETGRTVFTKSGESEHRLVRFVATGSYRLFDSGHVEDGISIEHDVGRSLLYFHDNYLSLYWPTHRQREEFGRADVSLLSMKCRYDLLVEATGWWPPTDDVDHFPDGAWADQLLHVIVDKPDCSLLAVDETIDGHSCVVLRPAADETLWLGRDLGYAVVRRQIARRSNIPARVYDNSDFRQVAPGVWMPMTFSRKLYESLQTDKRASPELFGIVTRKIMSIRTNDDVDGSVFVPTTPAGCIVADRTSNQIRVYPGGHELLDESVRLAQTRAPECVQDISYTTPRHMSRGVAVAVLISNLLIGVISCASFLLRSRTKQAQHSHC